MCGTRAESIRVLGHSGSISPRMPSGSTLSRPMLGMSRKRGLQHAPRLKNSIPRYGALAVFDSSGSIQQFVTRGITEAERERVGGIPQGKGLLGLLQTVQKPLRLSDLSTHPQSVDFPPHHPAMKSFLGAPIRDEEEHLGNLYLTEKDGAIEFTEEDEDLIVMFASQAAMAIRNARQFLAL